jgi:hypothetical protein
METLMEYKGFKAQIMEAERLTGDCVHGLPPGKAIKCYPVDIFLGAPISWCKGPGSFVVPVRPGYGLWFNWTQNDGNNTAVLPTVKGCNPITGLPTSGYHLERYDTKCPKHGVDFMHGRFCPECNYKWKPQNYVAAPNTLWWDVWASEDGIGRQFFFTEDELRDVATSILGEDKIPAFGFAFYRPKVMREVQKAVYRGSIIYNTLSSDSFTNAVLDSKYKTYTTCSSDSIVGDTKSSSTMKGIMKSKKVLESFTAGNYSNDTEAVYMCDTAPVYKMVPVTDGDMDMGVLGLVERSVDIPKVKEVSIAAGAKIAQNISEDPYSLDSWKETPEAVMTIYFVFQEKFEEIKSGGIRDLSGKKEGMLSGIPVG